ncbi:hypothetical protein AYL99_04008 [Fonsecaea erecta]|uniref:Uncharacterized protein n=1 Tax=Fonsecaea erecta TaxID=1367422 RepID=A0A178ZS24_9EURO|nr:hypothetical protein AYL99_04008 [Fonsecaea erecta]OAP61805.1 hypothetical protein AYL99_04008 [Fonsecaea erecta]
MESSISYCIEDELRSPACGSVCQSTKEKAKKRLSEKSDGMYLSPSFLKREFQFVGAYSMVFHRFLYAILQFQNMRDYYPITVMDIDMVLEELLYGLHETYDLMLRCINEKKRLLAIRILTWMFEDLADFIPLISALWMPSMMTRHGKRPLRVRDPYA